MRKGEIIGLSVATVVLIIVLSTLINIGKLDFAQAIQITITFVLVLVTVIYVLRTSEIAKATREQAEASVKMAEEMREQRYDEVRPVIDIQAVFKSDAAISAASLSKIQFLFT